MRNAHGGAASLGTLLSTYDSVPAHKPPPDMSRIPLSDRSRRPSPSPAHRSSTSSSHTAPRPARPTSSNPSADPVTHSASAPLDAAGERPRSIPSGTSQDESLAAGTKDRTPDSVTHFSGVWNDDAKSEVTRAIQAAERLIAHRNEFPVPTFGSQWVCVADEVVDRTYFLAHRLGATHVLRGTSVQELKDAICAFALER